MIPYIVTIVAIAGFVGKVRPPAAAGGAYEGGGAGDLRGLTRAHGTSQP